MLMGDDSGTQEAKRGEGGEKSPHARSVTSSSSDSKHSNPPPQTPKKYQETENDSSDSKNLKNPNRVYKYFSNPTRWEFSRRRKSFPEEIKLPGVKSDIEEHAELTCFHLGDKICPICDAPLRNYESCCLRCQKKLSLKFCSRRSGDGVVEKHNHGEIDGDGDHSSSNDSKATFVVRQLKTASSNSFALVCVNCERLYTLCADCVRKSDVCRACHRKRNVCMHCRRTLCAFCLDEIASGKDIERTHINERDSEDNLPRKSIVPGMVNNEPKEQVNSTVTTEETLQIVEKPIASNESSFLVLPDSSDSSSTKSVKQTIPLPPYGEKIPNNLRQLPETSIRRAPFSLQFKRNTTQRLPKLVDKEFSFIVQDSLPATQKWKSIENNVVTTSDQSNSPPSEVDITQQQADSPSKVPSSNSSYNGSQQQSEDEKASILGLTNHRGTQTQPLSAGRRDVILYEENNLAMPLLHEMPKMMRSPEEEAHLLEIWQQKNWLNHKTSREATTGNGQKSYISTTFPHVYTQIGAIRSQLHAS